MANPGFTPGDAGGGGAALVVHHGKTTRKALQMQWDYPVFQKKTSRPGKVSDNATGASAVLDALPREQAFLYIAGEDPRPLLILRECEFCNGTDDALLSKTEGNENTLLMARWFHCVKLPTHVLKENHPFTRLFSEYPAKSMPHLFLVSRDGSKAIPLKGDQSQTELWKAMESVIAVDYKKKYEPSLKEVKKILVRYDTLDAEEALKEERMQLELEANGPKSKKLKKLQLELLRVEKERKKLKLREAKLMDLGLKREKVEKDIVLTNLAGKD